MKLISDPSTKNALIVIKNIQQFNKKDPYFSSIILKLHEIYLKNK
jgi:hypothetical protein